MTTADLTSADRTTLVPSSPAERPSRPRVSDTRRTIRYTGMTTVLTLRNGMFVFFTVALPIIMFLLLDAMYGDYTAGDATVGAVLMTNMAAYGGLGAALNAGSMIQLERASGWLRQLTVAGLTPRSFVIGKLVAAMVVVLPALIGVFLAGVLVAGVELTWPVALRTLGLLWIAMLPLVLLGLAIGLALKPSAVSAVTTIGSLLLALLGGLWFPLEMFPDWTLTVSRLTPTYWVGQLGSWGIGAGEGSLMALAVLGGWTLGLGLLCALLLRRATRAASRR